MVFGGFRWQGLGRVWADVRRWLRRWRSPVAAALAVVLTVSLTVVVVLQAQQHRQAQGPAQQTWGSVADPPHLVPASATIEHLVGGRLVPYAVGARRARRPGPVSQAVVLPAAHRPRNAVLPQRRPPKVRIHVAARPRVRLSHPHPGQAPPVAGYQPRTSQPLAAQASANKIVYANADGTRTAFVFQSPVNYRRASGSWTPINTTLVPAGGAASPRYITSAPRLPAKAISATATAKPPSLRS